MRLQPRKTVTTLRTGTMMIFSMLSLPLFPYLFLAASGQGVSSPDKALAPLRVVAADGGEWGLESPGAIIDVGEEIGEAGQRKTKVQFELLENCFFYGMFFFLME